MGAQGVKVADARTKRPSRLMGRWAEFTDWFSFRFLEGRHDDKLGAEVKRIVDDPESEWVPLEQVRKELSV